MAWVAKHKYASALAKIQLALDGTSTIQAYHSLLGLRVLEHLVYLNRMKRQIMYYL